MAGHCAIINGQKVFIDYPDAEGSAIVNGRVWRWEWHDYLGPTFLKKDGNPRKCQCPTVKAVWDAFEKWLKRYVRKKGIALVTQKYANPPLTPASPAPAPAPVRR